ncbi:MAG: hypothetical protein QN756_10980, partial [Nitrososphaeraceae archaeon]|nr:hypothetical protein [Nitrososphaeraceae archaeon]
WIKRQIFQSMATAETTEKSKFELTQVGRELSKAILTVDKVAKAELLYFTCDSVNEAIRLRKSFEN